MQHHANEPACRLGQTNPKAPNNGHKRRRYPINVRLLTLTAASALALTGCATQMFPKQKIQPDTYYQLAQDRENGSSSSAATTKTAKMRRGKVEALPPYLRNVLDSFQTSAENSRAVPQDHVLAVQFLDHGMALTNLLCADFLAEITHQRQERNYDRDFASNINTGLSALLNLTKSSNLATGTVSALFGGIDADYQSRDRHYVAAVDLAAAEALVRGAMAEQAEKNRNLTRPTYSEVENRLIQYAGTCSFNGIKTLVNQSVAAGVGLVEVDKSGAAKINNERPAGSKALQAAADQDDAFEALGDCKFDEALALFKSAEASYPGFQVSYEYAKALSQGNNTTKIDALLALQKEIGRMPQDVQAKLADACKGVK
ncbi:hypothetical protein [Pseudomonas sp. CGJS7]|uniref:hypothetical protein n=1 Tax=Pseudomonas sp. CGJS7 TaxID=3109348 RepID=UPI0030080368